MEIFHAIGTDDKEVFEVRIDKNKNGKVVLVPDDFQSDVINRIMKKNDESTLKVMKKICENVADAVRLNGTKQAVDEWYQLNDSPQT